MVLVDTSIWIDHYKKGNVSLEKLLLDIKIICHAFIIGELACGNLKNRKEIISLLHSLPMAPSLDHDEILYFNPGSAGPLRFSLPVSVGIILWKGQKIIPEIIHLKDL